ncbi:MAG: ATP-binding cassette domain-containing protein [Sulfolobales archaeon]
MLALTQSPAVELKGAVFSYGDKRVLNGLDLEVFYGEAIAIMGRSGVGKTTLLKIVAGLLKPERGVIRILGCDLSNKCFDNVRGRIAYIPQTLGLIEGGSALYNVLLARAYEKPLRFITGIWGKEYISKALEALEAVGLLEKARARVERLSGGERQRVAIARAIFQGAPVILADEPVSNLDFESARDVVELLTGLRKRGVAIVAVMHDRDLAHRYFDRVYILEGGVLRVLS